MKKKLKNLHQKLILNKPLIIFGAIVKMKMLSYKLCIVSLVNVPLKWVKEEIVMLHLIFGKIVLVDVTRMYAKYI